MRVQTVNQPAPPLGGSATDVVPASVPSTFCSLFSTQAVCLLGDFLLDTLRQPASLWMGAALDV